MIPVRIRRLLLWGALPALVLVLLYTVLGFFLVPRLVRSGVHDFVTQNYHREVALGEIRFNPYTLRLDVRDFALPDTDGQPMLAFGHLVVDLTVASVWHWGPDFEAILLEQPFARVQIRKDGNLNLGDLALPPSAEAKPEPKPQPVRLFINHFNVQSGNVAFEDLAHPSPFRTEIKPITFDLRQFSTVTKKGGTYVLNAASEAGEQFTWSGSLTGAPVASHGEFKVENLQAQTIWNYLRDSVRFELPSGVISIAGDYDFTSGTTPAGLAVNVREATVADLGIRPQGTTADYIKLSRVELHDTRADVAKRTVDVGSVRLAGGEVRAWMPGAQGAVLNLLELVATAASTAAANPTTTPTEPPAQAWVVSVPDVAVDNLKIVAEDRHLEPAVTLQLNELGLHVNGFTTSRSAPVAVTITSKINKGAKLDAKADLSPDLAKMKIEATLADLDLTAFQPYIAQRTSMTLRNGLLSTKLNAERGADGQLSVAGDVTVTKLRTIDNELKRDFIKFDHLQIAGLDYQGNLSDSSKPASLHVRNILARVPYARVIIEPDQTTNVGRVLRLKKSPPGETPSPGTDGAHSSQRHAKRGQSAVAAAPAHDGSTAIAIDAINIQDGSANYADLWIQPHFAIGIQTLNGSILGLTSNPRGHAKVDLKGKVDRYAPIHIWGETNPLAATSYSDIKMSFKGVELSSVTPYSGRFAGYKIEKGKLSADIDYKIDNRKLTATHKFVVDQLELGERVESPDAVKLPLKIAVALLKDRNGVIDLDLPVTGSLDDPQFKVGPLIWKAFVGLLTKIATAPFALLGHLFGGGEQMNYIDFQPGSAVLEQPERDKLQALVKALKEKEKLELDVPITYAPDVDRPGLATAHLNQQLLALKQDQASGAKRGKGGLRAVSNQTPPDNAAPPKAVQPGRPDVFGDPPPRSAFMDEPPPTDPALTDPAQRYKLLVALYRTELGKSAPLPDAAKEIEGGGKKKGESPPDFAAVNAQLEAALLQKMPVADNELEVLGKHRARAIQEVLLVGTDIDPSRVFVIGKAPKPGAEKDKVRVELSLK
jgi:hypothetical protein